MNSEHDILKINKRTVIFYHYLKKGHNRFTWKFWNEGVDVNFKKHNGRIALHYAFRVYKTDIVKAIVERTIDLDARDFTGKSPLHYAVIDGSPEGVELLLKEGATVDAMDRYGNTPLYFALGVENPESAKILMENGADLELDNNPYFSTGLHVVMQNNAMSDDDKKYAVNLLLEKEVNVNARNREGETPLHVLLKCDRTSVTYELCDLLLKKGANVLMQGKFGQTPLHVAIECSASYKTKKIPVELVKLLLDSGAEIECKSKIENILHDRCGWKVVSLPTALVEGPLINGKTFDGMTPLHYAVKVGVKEIVELLVNRGADVNSKNKKGQTPLFHVSNMNILSRLILMGADVNVQDMNGRTFMHCMACGERSWNDEFIDELLDWGALLSIKAKTGKTPVDLCNEYRCPRKFTNNNLKYLIRRACLNLPKDLTEEMLRSDELISYQESCRMEVDKMKRTKFENNLLYDIFRQWDYPKYLNNKELETKVKSTELKVLFPIYSSLMKSTYIKAKKRVVLLDTAADILNIPLPREVTWHILSFVDDDSLLNVINVKGTI